MNSKAFCYSALVLFAALSAGRDVFAKELFQNKSVDPIFFTWVGSSVTWIIFYFTVSVRFSKPYLFEDISALSTRLKARLLLLNVATLIAFGTAMLAVKELNAYFAAVLDYGASPLVIAGLAAWLRGVRVTKLGMLGMGFSFLGIVGLSHRMIDATKTSELGIIYAVVSCFSMAFAQILTKDLISARITRDKLMVARLPLLVVGMGAWSFAGGHYHVGVDWMQLVLTGVFGWSLPLFLIVLAVEQLQVKDVSLAFFLVPVFTFVGTMARGHFGSGTIIWPYAVAGIIVLAGVVIAERNSS